MREHTPLSSIGSCSLILALAGCGGAVGSGVSVGKIGQQLSVHAQVVPQGGEACALKSGLGQQQGPEKPIDTTCEKELKADRVWNGALHALAAYGDTLGTVAGGAGSDTSGQIEAAAAGAPPDAADAADGAEKAARDAAAALLEQLARMESKDDPADLIKRAAPHVKSICDGLPGYLDAQAASIGDALKEAEKKRISPNDRRCGTLDNRSICVGDTAVDRAVYASTYGRLTRLEQSHRRARDGVAGFCAAHVKLEEAAKSGSLEDDATVTAIAEAVKSARGAAPAPAAGPADSKAAPAADPKAAPKK